jgi:dihydrofolate synthase/folylpolyglutamate synthase
MADKETGLMLEMISSISASVTVTHFDYKRVAELAVLLEQTPHHTKQAIDDPVKAVEVLLNRAKTDEIILITGSLYFVSYIRPYLIERLTSPNV